MEKFWLVWNPDGRAPTHKHYSFVDAKAEAKRLARNNPDQDFHVMEAVGTARKTDVSFYAHNHDDADIPF